MKALISRDPGPPETLVLADGPRPPCGPDQVLLRVSACGVTYPDVLLIQDRYQYRPARPFSPGCEFAGEVVETGADVRGLAVGQRVAASSNEGGGMAEYAAAPAGACIPIPDGMPDDDAAAFFGNYTTAWHALVERGRLRAGQVVLVLGAAGGVGLAAVQIARAMGARVVVAVSSPEKLNRARENGADDGIVYARAPLDKPAQRALAQDLKRLCGPGGADVVFDVVGGDYAEPALRAIAWKGWYLVVGFAAGIPHLPLNLVLLKG